MMVKSKKRMRQLAQEARIEQLDNDDGGPTDKWMTKKIYYICKHRLKFSQGGCKNFMLPGKISIGSFNPLTRKRGITKRRSGTYKCAQAGTFNLILVFLGYLLAAFSAEMGTDSRAMEMGPTFQIAIVQDSHKIHLTVAGSTFHPWCKGIHLHRVISLTSNLANLSKDLQIMVSPNKGNQYGISLRKDQQGKGANFTLKIKTPRELGAAGGGCAWYHRLILTVRLSCVWMRIFFSELGCMVSQIVITSSTGFHGWSLRIKRDARQYLLIFRFRRCFHLPIRAQDCLERLSSKFLALY